MLLDYIRIFRYNGATLSDLSLSSQDKSLNLSLPLASTDYLYIGQRMPFCNLFFLSNVVNAIASAVTVEYWDGTNWIAAVDVMDGTSSSGATLAKSGLIQWTIQKDHGWQKVIDTTETNAPTELEDLTIYDTYWVRLSVSANLTAGTSIKEIAYAFTQSTELQTRDVEIDSYLPAFSSTKTDWFPEIITASKLVVSDLRRLGIIIGHGQIIELQDVYLAATLKTVSLIYFQLGKSYAEKKALIDKEYADAINLRRFRFDADGDGRLDPQEIKGIVQRRLVR